MPRTILALYDDLATAQGAITELVSAGFSRENISIVARDATGEYSRHMALYPAEGMDDHVGPIEGSAFGAAVGALTGALVALAALVIPGIGPVIAAGPLAAGLAGAATGAIAGGATGGIVGGLLNLGVSSDEASYYAEGVRRGGTLVSATVADEWANRVQAIMDRHNPVDIQQRAAEWRERGWTSSNERAVARPRGEVSREKDSPQAQTDTSSLDDTQPNRTRANNQSTRV
jgi:hypothetical protein